MACNIFTSYNLTLTLTVKYLAGTFFDNELLSCGMNLAIILAHLI